MKDFVPKNFQVPQRYQTDRFLLRMLTVRDVVLDYDAVVTSLDYLRSIQPLGPNMKWPSPNLTLEQDLIDLGWHQKEFQNRSSFAYTVMSLDENVCLGCLYIFPSPNSEYDAMVMMWVRSSEVERGLDDYLFETVKQWIEKEWPFKNPGYPGRKLTWEQWKKLN